MKTKSLKKITTVLTAAAVCACAFLFNVRPAQAADHRDSPTINEDPRADLLDVYAFVNPNNTNNIVLIWTINPAAVPGLLGITFSPDVLYQFKIDNTGDFVEDLVIQAIYTPPVPGPQQFTVLGPAKPENTTIVNSILDADEVRHFSGPVGGVVNGVEGMRAFNGLSDDPFFIDIVWFFRLLGIAPGGPLTNRPPGIDFYVGINCTTHALEVPASLLRGPNGNKINVWATTSRPTVSILAKRVDKETKTSRAFAQVDREGKPALNTVLIPGVRKDEYNRAVPSQDRQLFRAQAITSLTRLNNDPAYSATIADVLLPDVLNLDMGSQAGYLNGRAPQDDFVDLTLNVATKGAITTDNVNGNDVPFRTDFPFVAPPHPPR